MHHLYGTTAIVTGGTSGIGFATANALIAHKVNLVINARQLTGAVEELERKAAAQGVSTIFVPGDMRDAQISERLCAAAMNTFGRIDSVVHSAGGAAPGNAVDMPVEDWNDAFAVHVHSAFHLFRAAHKGLAVRGGSMVLLSSVAALRGCPGNTAYQVVKAALIQLARALARDHAAEGIRVNCVAPGIIRTPFHSGMTEATAHNNVTNRIPLRREGQPEDVASMIVQLLANDFVTGETVVVDGGMTMRMV